MIAQRRRTRTDTGADAEFAVGEEARPLVVLQVRAEAVSVQKSTN